MTITTSTASSTSARRCSSGAAAAFCQPGTRETGLSHFNRVGLDAAQASRFNMGQRLRNPEWPAGLVAVFGEDGKPLGLGQVDEGGVLSSQRRFNL